jgi:hypothetical protein
MLKMAEPYKLASVVKRERENKPPLAWSLGDDWTLDQVSVIFQQVKQAKKLLAEYKEKMVHMKLREQAAGRKARDVPCHDAACSS